MIDLGIPLTGSERRTKAFAQAELHFIIIVQYSDGNIHIDRNIHIDALAVM